MLLGAHEFDVDKLGSQGAQGKHGFEGGDAPTDDQHLETALGGSMRSCHHGPIRLRFAARPSPSSAS
jgi:hypothetical protein